MTRHEKQLVNRRGLWFFNFFLTCETTKQNSGQISGTTEKGGTVEKLQKNLAWVQHHGSSSCGPWRNTHKKNIFCWLSKAVLWLLNMVAVKYKTQNVIRRPNKNGPVKWYKSYTILCWCLSKLKSIVCFYLQLIWSYSWYDVWSLTQYLLAQPHSVQTKMKDGIDNKQSELE